MGDPKKVGVAWREPELARAHSEGESDNGSVSVGGTINRGARFVHATPDFTDVVNANGLEEGTKVVEIDGRPLGDGRPAPMLGRIRQLYKALVKRDVAARA